MEERFEYRYVGYDKDKKGKDVYLIWDNKNGKYLKTHRNALEGYSIREARRQVRLLNKAVNT